MVEMIKSIVYINDYSNYQRSNPTYTSKNVYFIGNNCNCYFIYINILYILILF